MLELIGTTCCEFGQIRERVMASSDPRMNYVMHLLTSPKDEACLEYLELAASQYGYYPALNDLGWFLYQPKDDDAPKGVEKDLNRAELLLKRACLDCGFCPSMEHLGELYQDQNNLLAAKEIYSIGMARGDLHCANQLAILVQFDGDEGRKQAFEIFSNLAAQTQHGISKSALGHLALWYLCGEDENSKTAFDLAIRADPECVPGRFVLATLFSEFRGIDPEKYTPAQAEKLAFQHYRFCASENDETSMVELAVCHQIGRGTEKRIDLGKNS